MLQRLLQSPSQSQKFDLIYILYTNDSYKITFVLNFDKNTNFRIVNRELYLDRIFIYLSTAKIQICTKNTWTG